MSAKRFRIAFSFAGEKRPFVKEVADILAKRFGQSAILYDKYHEAEFARRNLGIYLPELYHKEAELIIVVACASYESKEWCGLEWTAIHDLLKQRKDNEVMLAHFDRASIQGLYSTAGWIELDHKTPEQFAQLILERLAINEGKAKDHYTQPVTSGGEPTKPHAPHYLPRLDHFHGREKELVQIHDALRPEKRTWGALIAGPGGMGKTSLAVRAASLYSRDQFDPVIFVSIKDRALEDEGPRPVKVRFVSHYLGILDEIARALGRDDIPRSTPEDRARLILDALTGTRALLILDNLESLTPRTASASSSSSATYPAFAKPSSPPAAASAGASTSSNSTSSTKPPHSPPSPTSPSTTNCSPAPVWTTTAASGRPPLASRCSCAGQPGSSVAVPAAPSPLPSPFSAPARKETTPWSSSSATS